MTMRSTPSGATAPFDEMQRATLDRLMDLLIPASPDGRMPAARTLGLYDDVATMRAVDRERFERGLADLDERSVQAYGVAFVRLGPEPAKALVERLRSERSAFVQSFVTQTVGRYLSHPGVMPLIGLEARPLWPKGHAVAEGDWSLLDAVKRRDKIYREV